MKYLLVLLLVIGCASKKLQVNHTSLKWQTTIIDRKTSTTDTYPVGNCVDEVYQNSLFKVTCTADDGNVLMIYPLSDYKSGK